MCFAPPWSGGRICRRCPSQLPCLECSLASLSSRHGVSSRPLLELQRSAMMRQKNSATAGLPLGKAEAHQAEGPLGAAVGASKPDRRGGSLLAAPSADAAAALTVASPAAFVAAGGGLQHGGQGDHSSAGVLQYGQQHGRLSVSPRKELQQLPTESAAAECAAAATDARAAAAGVTLQQWQL
ncbi:hypothetical protein cyc_05891 [Cyclospora cayetanensis]|uniref:Uncharacterized protein n=1 Tax=Cyclospora cayetanensis TaxID=88456 RepID=A0A1D3DAL7_9EIME|nr:hypothetical protein cyc_05891 [Cyclospora cayetanensis]